MRLGRMLDRLSAGGRGRRRDLIREDANVMTIV